MNADAEPAGNIHTEPRRQRIRGTLRETLDHHRTRPAKIFDFVIQMLIICSVVSFSIETLPGLSDDTLAVLSAIELVTVAIFTAEYLLRLWIADYRLRFVFSFYGLMDLLAVAPYYLAVGLDLRSLRAFRLLRLFKFFRYRRSINLFNRAFWLIRDELVLFGAAALVILYLAAVGIYFFEHQAQPEVFRSVFHSLWWAVTTLTTVGYGDAYPVTTGGRIFTFLVLAIGLGIVAVPAGLMASALSKAREQEEQKTD